MNDVLMMPGPRTPEVQGGELPDAGARRQALDVSRSWVVEAPAGSGKTGLLIQRFLTLLASDGVRVPEEVLAITFTKAATAEMRERVLGQLRAARAAEPVTNPFAAETRPIAEAVLRRDRQLRWGLLEEPQRLRVQTIDALCGEIVRSQPVLSGGGGALKPVENADALYAEAARRTWQQMGGGDGALSAALEQILFSRAGDLDACTTLLAQMLETREQWRELMPLRPGVLTEEMLEGEIRPRLDRALEQVVCASLTELHAAIGPGALRELTTMAADLAERPVVPGKRSPLAICRELRQAPGAAAEDLQHWRALASLLLTQSGEWRKSFASGHLHVQRTAEDAKRLKEMVEGHLGNDRLLAALQEMRAVPEARYPDEQWAMAKALFRVLGRALIELEEVFGESGECDFAEPSLLARRVLDREAEADDGVALRTGGAGDGAAAPGTTGGLKHLLVDEMQDTSTSQHGLLQRLTRGWAGTGRTLFLVGDPKQSIYLFRHARVERFLKTMRTERMGEIKVGLLRLTANFRSQARLVQGFNEDFGAVFATERDAGPGEVSYTPAVAARGEGVGGGAVWHLSAGPRGERPMREQAQGHAKEIRQILEGWKARSADEPKPLRMAVLGPSRASLQAVMRALEEGERVGYRAVKVDPLAERREVLDLLALTRALLHPADRVAWLAVLRAPWCGLELSALHWLTGNDGPEFTGRTVRELVRERRTGLPKESRERLEGIWPMLEESMALRGRVRLPELVERTWRSLGGEALLEGPALENAQGYLRMLRSIDAERGAVSLVEVERRLGNLYAAPETQAMNLELMTIHGAKGLEWDVVIVPEMERQTGRDEGRLLSWEELPDGGGVVLAPLHGKGEEATRLTTWLRRLTKRRMEAEQKRLLYVACTRAREELHLFGVAERNAKGEVKPVAGTLLEAAWPAARGQMPERGQEVVREDVRVVASMAAAEEEPARLQRVAAGYRRFPAAGSNGDAATTQDGRSGDGAPGFVRPHGSMAARALGNAVHALLEEAARGIADGLTSEALWREAATWWTRAEVLLRAEGLAPEAAREQARTVQTAVRETLEDPIGGWLLGGRAAARSEFALVVGGAETRRYRMDRIFRAGATPGSPGEEYLWIVDYKTATHGTAGLDAFLAGEREKYRGQMEAYAGATKTSGVRLGLWYPLLRRLVWWTAPEAGETKG